MQIYFFVFFVVIYLVKVLLQQTQNSIDVHSQLVLINQSKLSQTKSVKVFVVCSRDNRFGADETC